MKDLGQVSTRKSRQRVPSLFLCYSTGTINFTFFFNLILCKDVAHRHASGKKIHTHKNNLKFFKFYFDRNQNEPADL